MEAIESRLQREVDELHLFFEGWLGGTLPATDEAFRRVETALGSHFSMVTPSGVEIDRRALLQMLRAGHGSRPGFRLWVEGTRILLQRSPVAIVRYEELQEQSGQRTRRVTSAVFEESAPSPNGFLWLRVHETWISAGD